VRRRRRRRLISSTFSVVPPSREISNDFLTKRKMGRMEARVGGAMWQDEPITIVRVPTTSLVRLEICEHKLSGP